MQSIHLLLQCSIHRCNGLSTIAMFQLLHRLPSTATQCTLSHCNATWLFSIATLSRPPCNTTQSPIATLTCNATGSPAATLSSHCNTVCPQVNIVAPLSCAIYPSAIAMFSSHCNTFLIAMQLSLPFQHSHPPLQHSHCNTLSFPQVEGQLAIDICAGCHILG